MPQFTTLPIDYQSINVSEGLEGNGTPATPIKPSDAGLANVKLANMATKRYKGRTSAGTGVPEDLTAAQLQSDLSIDDLITLSGRPEGSTTTGGGTGSILSDGTIKANLQELETAIEAVSGGSSSLTTYTETSGVNANNRMTVRYETVSGSPVVDVVWTGEGGAAPTVSANVTGGVILVKKVFTTYENTDASSRNLDITINGVGTQIDMAVPVCQKVYHQFDFTTGSASSQLYLDNDNTPQVQPFGYSAVSPGAISIRLTNIPSGERHGLNAIWQ